MGYKTFTRKLVPFLIFSKASVIAYTVGCIVHLFVFLEKRYKEGLLYIRIKEIICFMKEVD